MGLLGNARIAVRAMLRRPLRTFLVLQGVVWAAAIMVFPSAIEQGSIRNAIQNASRFKTDEITVRAYERPGAEKLTMADLDAIWKALAGRECCIAPFRTSTGEALAGTKIIKTTVVGTDERATSTRSFRTRKGRFITAADLKEGRRVCVLEALAARELFPKESPLDRRVVLRFADHLLFVRVVGVMEKRNEEELATDDQGFRLETGLLKNGPRFRMRWFREMIGKLKFMLGVPPEDTSWKRSERCVQIPLSLIPRQDDSLDWVIVRTNPLKVMETARLIRQVLISRNKDPIVLHNIFLPILLSDQLKVKDDLTTALFVLCLIMGGIVIANIMLMSVMERQREIAIRRVEGASKWDIVYQFLTEGMVLSLVGAVFGVPLGLGLAYIVSLFEPYAISGVSVPLKDAAVAFGCAILLGAAAAILPAKRAAALDPVVILQNE